MTTILFRPVGLEELRLVYATRMAAFPPRLPEQPIFHPVLNEEYARQIARDWNTKSGSLAGFVTRFAVDDAYAARFERHIVGAIMHEELWVPAEELAEFNGHIVGEIDVVAAYFGDGWRALVADQSALAAMLDWLADGVGSDVDGDVKCLRALREASLVIHRELAASDPEERMWLACALDSCADAAGSDDDVEHEAVFRDEAIALLRPLIAEEPADWFLMDSLGSALTDRGRRRFESGDLDAARVDADEAAAVLRVAAAAEACSLGGLAESLELALDVARKRKDWAAGLAASVEWAATLRLIGPRLEADKRTLEDLGSALRSIGDMHSRLDDHAAARAAYEEALAFHRERSVAEPDDPDWARHVANLLGDLAGTARRMDDQAAARRLYGEMREAYAAAIERFPDDLDLARSQFWDLDAAAFFLEGAADDLDAALALRIEHVSVARRIAVLDPSIDARDDVRSALISFGDLRDTRGEKSDAADAYREAASIARALVAEDPDDRDRLNSLAFPLAQLRDVLEDLGASEEAFAVSREIVPIQRAIVADAPMDLEMLRELAVDLDQLGDRLRDTGDVAGAGAAYEEAEAIARGLVATDGERTQWRDDLAIVLGRRGRLALDGNDPAAAVVALAASVDEHRVLAAQEPGEVKWRAKLGYRLAELGEAHASAGDPQTTLVAYDEAIALLLETRGHEDGATDERIRETLVEAADAAAATGRPDRAAELRARAAEIDPTA